MNPKKLIMKTRITLKLIICLFIFSSLAGSVNAIAQPVNDHIIDATDLSQGPIMYVEENVSFTQATITDDSGQQGCGTGVAGVWYKFTATASGNVGASIEPYVQPIVVFYSASNENATSGQDLTYVEQQTNPCENSNFSSIIATEGTTYYIFMKNDVDATVGINLENVFATPANDLIENATNLNGLEDYFDDNVHMLMTTVTNDAGQNGCDTNSAVRAVWYKFTAGTDGQVIAGIGTPLNASAVIFYSAENENATSGADLTHVDQSSNPCSENNLASIDAIAGTTYYILAFTVLPWADVSINLSGVLGVADNTIEGFSFYPNPASNLLNLNAKNSIDEVQLFNLLGQKVIHEKVGATAGSLDLSHLQTGLYVMTVTSEGRTTSFKVVKK
jgi:hypothetical protein